MERAQTISDLTKQNVETIAAMENASKQDRSLGDNVADTVAAAVGSWPFIIVQTIVLTLWVIINVAGWMYRWDPYPFILLNLVLSFQAAYASPIIMMSQNRQEKLNDRRNRLDLQINILAEQENTEMLKLLRLLCHKAGIELPESNAALEQAIEPENLVRQIEGAIKK